MLYYFVPVLSNPLELEAITFKTVLKAIWFVPDISGNRESYPKNLSSTATGWLLSIHPKVSPHKKCSFCFQAISSSHASLVEECENEAVGELLGKFCCVRKLITIKLVGQCHCLLAASFTSHRTGRTNRWEAECKLHTEEGEWEGDTATNILTETGEWICIPCIQIWIFRPK